MMHHLISPLSLLLAILPVRAYEVTQCYWAKGQTLPQISGLPNSYIPCGEIDDGVQPCCRVGHNCLEAGACYAPDAGMVYTAGCTDRDYASSSCPSKCGISAFWVGHSYCNGTSNNWSCCDNQHGDTLNQQFFPYNNEQQCWCPEENAMIGFHAPKTIPDVAYLDLEHPGSISYFPGHTPSAALGGSSTAASPASTTSDTDSSTTFTTSTMQTSESSSSSSRNSNPNTNTNSPASNTAFPSNGSSASHSADPDSTSSPLTSDPGLPTGTKIGIGVGAGAGAVILASLLYLLLSFLRKRHKRPPPPIQEQIRPKSIGSSYAGIMSEAANAQSPTGDARSPAWSSGHRSELPADEDAVVSASPTIGSTTSPSMPSHPVAAAEVEATTSRQSVQSSGSQMARGSATSQPGYGADGIKHYIPYNPARGGKSIAELPG
ncbi:hypothetical protein GJ744_001823 [Endocarpon pusillum]|uniref:Mid2 domain-containing protein n=1 Tax=Endocarpon pusillum TaxID=364733 RepID=A0A8H7AW74_9EURO|nr:hypothetical protein GJ744_001823 [Endocarpon pusillum]